MKKVYSFLVIMLALTGLILLVTGRPGDGATPCSAQSQAGKPKPTFTGEFYLRETLSYVSHGKCDLDLQGTISFIVSWDEKIGVWVIKGSLRGATGTSVATGPYGSKCQAPLKGRIDINGHVTGEKLEVCCFHLNINQEWEKYFSTCHVAKIPPLQMENPGFTLNHVYDYDAGPGYHSKEVEAGIMKGHLHLQLKKFSGTLIDGCGVMY